MRHRPAAKAEFCLDATDATEEAEENQIWRRVDERLPGLGEEFNCDGRRVARAKHTAQRKSVKPFVQRLCQKKNGEGAEDEEGVQTEEGAGQKYASAFCREVFRAAGDPRRMKFKIDGCFFNLSFDSD